VRRHNFWCGLFALGFLPYVFIAPRDVSPITIHVFPHFLYTAASPATEEESEREREKGQEDGKEKGHTCRRPPAVESSLRGVVAGVEHLISPPYQPTSHGVLVQP
jgi:hypothetical protein